MGFNKKILPNLEILKSIRERYSSDEEFLRWQFGKADCIMGPDESIEYLREIEKRELERCQQQS